MSAGPSCRLFSTSNHS